MKLQYKGKLHLETSVHPFDKNDTIQSYHSDVQTTYNEEKILSGVDAYKVMLKFLDEYIFPHVKDDEFLFRLSNMQFNWHNETMYDEPWDIWEELVNNHLKQNKDV